jgi:nitroreductase
MSGARLSFDDLAPLFEAARWAPSCANSQPWRFVYGLAGTPAFDALFATLAPGNKVWCERAGALALVCARTTMDDGKTSPTPAFDAGAAWMSFALEGSLRGLVVHAMAGFDAAAARAACGVPDDHLVLVAVAVGKPGDPALLPEGLRAREAPNARRPVEELVREGRF